MLQDQLTILNEKIQHLPEGKLIYSKNGGHTKWYKSNGSEPIYIPKRNRKTAEYLAIKKFYLCQINEYSYQLKLISEFLTRLEKHPSMSLQMLDYSSAYSSLLLSYFQPSQDNMTTWSSQNYVQNKNHPEHLIHRCLDGHYVRSKSEVIIANSLYMNHIPYRYECELILDEVQLFPDFTICHPSTHQIYYWEHFGLMSNHFYRENTFHKLKLYSDHDILPTMQLITTYETTDFPIDSEKIHKIISEYFL